MVSFKCGITAVSYTHLDVYKRQALAVSQPFIEEESSHFYTAKICNLVSDGAKHTLYLMIFTLANSNLALFIGCLLYTSKGCVC